MAATAEKLDFDRSTTALDTADHARYLRALKASKRVRWDIDADVIRAREFDYQHKFLPDGLSLVGDLDFLTETQMRLWSQVQGRTYAYIFGLVERYIGAKVLELSAGHTLGDQVALEALVRFGDEEIKHQALFRQLEAMFDAGMPAGYVRTADPNEVARAVLSMSSWSVLALTCQIELFVQSHYEQSIEPDATMSPLFRDVFMYHWREECQHAIIDEIEWRREDARLTQQQKERAVNDLIALVGAVDGILQAQAAADAGYFMQICGEGSFKPAQRARILMQMLKAYRWQYIVTGAQHPHFGRLLTSMTTAEQMGRIQLALAPIVAS
ncbi:MAG TPA: hypothetical protein VF277_08665 [Steroidobacteraceae bacterium]